MSFSTPAFRHAAVIAAFFVAYAVCESASAASSEALDAVSISLGDYVVSPRASVGVNTQYGALSSGDISSHEVSVPRVKLDFLLGSSQGLSFDYYGFYRNYSDTAGQAFSVGPNNVNIVGTANSNFGLDVANVSYKWWFGQEADVFGVGLGAAYYRISVGVDGNVATNINNASASLGSSSYSADTIAPLLKLGWRHAFSPNVRMYVDLSGVAKNGGNLTGHIYDASIGAEWYFTKNVGVGVEYSATRVSINGDNGNQNLDLRMDGPSVFLKMRF